jgi:hypothetical protein
VGAVDGQIERRRPIAKFVALFRRAADGATALLTPLEILKSTMTSLTRWAIAQLWPPALGPWKRDSTRVIAMKLV